jgi:hypothetical protein
MSTDDDYIAEENDQYCVARKVADQWLAGSPWRRLAVLGDNVTRSSGQWVPGYRRLSWAQRTVQHLMSQQPDLAVFNRGRRDMPIAEVRAQQLRPVLDFKPDLTAVWCGGHEIFSRSFDADAIEMEVKRIVVALHRQRCEVILVRPLDFTWSPHIPAELKSPMRQLLHLISARESEVALHHGALYANLVSHPAALDGSTFNHGSRYLNSRGHAIVATEVLRCLAARLGNYTNYQEEHYG